MKSLTVLVIFLSVSLQVTGQTSARFEDYEVVIYRGTIHRPKWIRRIADDEWRDEVGKRGEPPEINFAGKYFVCVHSCGTRCSQDRYQPSLVSQQRQRVLLRFVAARDVL